MSDTDKLRPQVATALGFIERNQKYGDGSVCAGDIDVIRAELLRLTEYEQGAGRLAVEKAEFRQRAEKAEAEIAALKKIQSELVDRVVRAEHAEAELAALRKAIDDAPSSIATVLGDRLHFGRVCGDARSLDGQRVRLLSEDAEPTG